MRPSKQEERNIIKIRKTRTSKREREREIKRAKIAHINNERCK